MNILWVKSYILIHLSVCCLWQGFFYPLTVSARPILLQMHFLCFNIMAEPVIANKNEVPKWTAPSLKCSSARCGSWWRRDTRSLDPPSPRIDIYILTAWKGKPCYIGQFKSTVVGNLTVGENKQPIGAPVQTRRRFLN